MLAAQILHRLRQLVASRHPSLGGTAAGRAALRRPARGRSQRTSLWQLVPTADPDDARWRGQPVWEDIVVRAETAAEAYSVAAALLSDPGNDESAATAARDMFALRELPAGNEVDAGEGAILSLRLRGRRPLPTEPASP